MLLSDLIDLSVTGPVGPKRHSTFFGYERTGVRRPAPLAAWFRWRERGAFLVAWDDVAGVGADGVRLRDGFTQWSSSLPSRGGLP